MLTLGTDIIKINRVGESTVKRLKKLGIKTARDLLFYFPFRYDDFTQQTAINKLQAGVSANVVGQVELIQNKRSKNKRMYITEALINDGTDSLKVVWFNQPFITNSLRSGDKVSLAGRVEDEYGCLVMVSPVYEKVFLTQNSTPPTTPCQGGTQPPLVRGDSNPPNHPYQEGNNIHTQGFVPNYHLTAKITQKQIRFLIKQIIDLAGQLVDWLPKEIKQELKLLNLDQAISQIHFPKNNLAITQANQRLAFDELFLIQVQSQLTKMELNKSKAIAIDFHEKETKDFVDKLPFKLTNAQRQSAWEIIKDIEKHKPMARLLEGEVGSGKTLVACIAMLNVALAGKQAVLMVPTEILARQHYDTICKLFAEFNLKIGLVTSSQKQISNFQFPIFNKISKTKLFKLKTKDIINNSDVIVGTHALIQDKIKFKNLALAVIDEQHRFGVEQRALLSRTNADKNGLMPHLLSMTATPIPRSLALALYGDLDLSVINELPKNRKKIITKVVAEEKRLKAYEFIKDQINQGRQVFVICPLIDLSDKLGVKSVEDEYVKLDKIIFPNIAIGRLHGRLKFVEKEKTMQDFFDNKIKILVSTSVVEVGVDVPNATIMMIEGADRFGLAQIHQFRGRVGRSNWQSYCFLFTDSQIDKTLERLNALVKCSNGFDLAKIDLKLRGPGEVYGTMQKGFPELKIASLFDYVLMKQARDQAIKLINQDPTLSIWPKLKEKLHETGKIIHPE
ncbi:MAG: ATP-dependent DNA helicase RecG [Patescibacteria group bacterium]